MRPLRPARVLAGCVLLLGGAVACSGDDEPSGVEPLEPRDRVEYASTDIPKDRPADAVEAALGSLDACALLDPRGGGVDGYPASSEVEARAPHSCEVTNPDQDDVKLTFGVEFSTGDRFSKHLVSLGGAKAYVLTSPTDSTFCQVELPVSFTHSIELRATNYGVGSDACGDARAFGALVARRLTTPDRFALPSDPERWTACDVLRPAVDLKRGTEIRSGWDFTTGLDQCGVWDKNGAALSGGLEFEPTAPRAYLSIEYDSRAYDYDRDFGTIAGRRLTGYASGTCVLAWNERDAPPAAGEGMATRFQVNASSCKRAKRLVADVAKVIDEDRVEAPADPQRPVLYSPVEPDVPAVDACVDVPDFAESDCQPYAEADAPTDGEETVDAAAADPNVNCAIAIDAVHRHFGDDLDPVTALRGTDATGKPRYACGFVEETHSLQVWIVASKDPMYQTAGSDIDGHPAHDETTVSEGTRRMWVALDREEDPGHLYAEVVVLPSRKTGMYSDSPVNEKPLEKLDEAMADIVAEHF